uniref:Cytochrome b5 heme-binding domain-containing protein n=1 Tax=Phaeomonas parva TaxID=124430 RepID=A0A7S1Y1B1_9STRA
MGKGSNAAPAAGNTVTKLDDTEVLIDGRLYDVSSFKHPGGSIIKFLTGNGDATEAYREFHMRSASADKMLASLPSRAAPSDVLSRREGNGKTSLSEDYAALRKQLEEEGFFEPSMTECVYRTSEIIAMHLLGAYIFMTNESMGMKALGLVVLGLAQGRCGWLMHEGGHYSMTGHIPTDRVLQVAIYGIGCGMSGAWWRNQHNKHHATPQKLQHDVDLDTLPLVAFNEACIDKVRSPILKTWLRFQGALFIPVSCLLVALGWQFYLHPRHIARSITSKRNAARGADKRAMGEAAALATRYALLFGGVFSGLTWGQSWGCYLFYNFIGAAYIFTNFSLSHTHLPVSKPDEYLHWVEYSAIHTTNISPNFLCNWWMAYLNFQIEHHLFPSMPQFRHPIVSPRVRALFEKHGMRYDERPYFSCLWETLMNLHNVGAAAQKKTA